MDLLRERRLFLFKREETVARLEREVEVIFISEYNYVVTLSAR